MRLGFAKYGIYCSTITFRRLETLPIYRRKAMRGFLDFDAAQEAPSELASRTRDVRV